MLFANSAFNFVKNLENLVWAVASSEAKDTSLLCALWCGLTYNDQTYKDGAAELVYPFLTNRLVHPYYLGESISRFRVFTFIVQCILPRLSSKQTKLTLIKHCILQHLQGLHCLSMSPKQVSLLNRFDIKVIWSANLCSCCKWKFINLSKFAPYKWDIGIQCIPGRDTASCGVSSGSSFFAWKIHQYMLKS